MNGFQLYEQTKGKHIFDYESISRKPKIKDSRLKSFEWTDTGIKLRFKDIDKELDIGKYQGEVTIGSDYKQSIIEVREILGKSCVVLIIFENYRIYNVFFCFGSVEAKIIPR